MQYITKNNKKEKRWYSDIKCRQYLKTKNGDKTGALKRALK